MGKGRSPHDPATRIQRRKYLRALAAGGVLPILAGCSTGGDGGDGGSDGGDGGSDGSDGTDGGDGQSDGASSGSAPDELSFLTWNIGWMEDAVNGWMEDFRSIRGGKYSETELNWIDKPGEDLPTFLQSQLSAGTPPELTNLMGPVYTQYAAEDVLAPMSEYFSEDFTSQFGNLDLHSIDGSLYRLPLYTNTQMLYFRRQWFEEAGVDPPTIDEPFSTTDFLDASEAVVNNSGAEFAFTALKFTYYIFSFWQTEGINVLNDSNDQAAFNTDRALEILSRLNDLTEQGIIPEVAWTNRWEVPIQQFASGNTAMMLGESSTLSQIVSTGDWVDSDTLGIAGGLGNTGPLVVMGFSMIDPTHDDGIKQGAADFLTVVMNEKWNRNFANNNTDLPGNVQVLDDLSSDEEWRSDNPLKARVYDVYFNNQDSLWLPPQIPESFEISRILDQELSAGAVGEKSPEQALSDAEQQVNSLF